MRAVWLMFQLVAPLLLQQPIKLKKEIRDTSRNYLVIHYDSSTTYTITRRWLIKKRLAYHYFIKPDGTVVKLLDPKFKGAHAGVSYYDGMVGMNNHSIGICLENIPPTKYTDKQYTSLAWLILNLEHRWPDIQDHPILGHSDVAIPRNRKKDPGPQFQRAYLDSILKANRVLTKDNAHSTL